MDKLKSFTSSSLFLPIVALAVLLIFNGIFVEGFFDIQITEDGRLFGRVIDILTRSSSLRRILCSTPCPLTPPWFFQAGI